jgi:hypothetical protein
MEKYCRDTDFGPVFKNNWEDKVVTRTVMVSNALSSQSENAFGIQLPTRIYNVLCVKLHMVEFRGNVSRMVNADGSLKPFVIFINDYSQVISNNTNVDGAYAYISSHAKEGTTAIKFVNTAGNPFDDTYSYIFNPNSTSVDRFNVKVCDTNGDPIFQPSDNVSASMVLFVYYRYTKGNI